MNDGLRINTDCALSLQDSRMRKIGTIWVRLDAKHPNIPSPSAAREDITSLGAEVRATLGNPKKLQITSALDAIDEASSQPGTTELFNTLISRLGKLKQENIAPIMEVIDDVAKVSL